MEWTIKSLKTVNNHVDAIDAETQAAVILAKPPWSQNRKVQKGHLWSAPLMFVCPRMCAHACCFAHLRRYLPSQSISHQHYSGNKENSQKLRTSFRWASKCLTFRKFGKGTGMFFIHSHSNVGSHRLSPYF